MFPAAKVIIEQTKGALGENDDLRSPMIWRSKGAEFGLTALDLPKSLGGLGFTCEQMADLFRYFGTIDLNLRDVPGIGHAQLMLGAGNLNQTLRALIDSVAKGKYFYAIAISEESGGSDIRSLKTEAKKAAEGYKINGKKKYIGRLLEATHIIVFAKTNKEQDDITAFVVPANTPGVSIELIDSMGLQGVSFGQLALHDVVVPEDLRIGAEGDGMALFVKHFTYWRTAMSAAAIGCASGAIKQTTHWLRHRSAFSGSIGRFSHLQQDLSKHTANLNMAWLLTATTMSRIDQGLPGFIYAAMTKAEAVEIALQATDWAMQVHGARGYTTELDLEKRVRDLLGLRVADGATDVLRGQVARSLLGDDMYEAALGRKSRPAHEHPLLIDELLW